MVDETDRPISLDQWKTAATELRRRMKVPDDFDGRVKEAFERSLIKQYWRPLYDAIMVRAKQSERVWATIIGTDRGTIYAWRGDLVGQKDRSREPSLHHVVKSMAAFNLDGTFFPDGLSATIEAYRETYSFVEEALGQRHDRSITAEEVLLLHLAGAKLACREFKRSSMRQQQTWCVAWAGSSSNPPSGVSKGYNPCCGRDSYPGPSWKR